MFRRCLTPAIVAVVAIFMATAPVSSQPVDEAKAKEIARLLELTDVAKMADQISAPMVELIIKDIRSRNPEIADKTIGIVREEFTRAFKESTKEMMAFSVGLYAKYFTRDDIKAMNRFYETEIGRKTLRVMPNLVQEILQYAQKWGPRVARETYKRVRDKMKAQGHKI